MSDDHVQGWDQSASAEPPRPLELGEVIASSFRVVGQNFPAFFLISLLVVIPATIVNFGVAIGMRLAMEGALTGDPAAMMASAVLGIAGYVVVVVVLSAAYALGQGAIMYATVESLVGRRASVGDALRAALQRLLPLWGASFLFGIAVAIGTLFCIVPGVLAWVWLVVTLPVCMVERLGPIASMQRSVELTEGHRGTIFVVFLVLFVGFMGIAICVMMPASIGMVAAAGSPADAQDPFSPLQLVIRAISAVLQIFSTMVLSAAIAVIYARLRGLRDGVNAQALAQVFA
ncbi:MAG: hypothetical protein M3Y87_21780 [Myxococcota bacterium]|nr:hypothetical protein [Myxococcota bacterium]